MSILTNILNASGNTSNRDSFNLKAAATVLKKGSELFWLTTSLALFLVMGPFSALAVIPAMFSLCSEKHRRNMKEPASC